MTRLFSARSGISFRNLFGACARARVRVTRAKKHPSAATPLRLSIYIARRIYRSLHRATSLLAHIFRITRRARELRAFYLQTSCIKLINIADGTPTALCCRPIAELCLYRLCVTTMPLTANLSLCDSVKLLMQLNIVVNCK